MTDALILNIPDEIVQNILLFLDFRSLSGCQRTCKYLLRQTQNPLLWRHHCLTQYHYWRNPPQLNPDFGASAHKEDWKYILQTRKIADRHLFNTLNSALVDRLERTNLLDEIAIRRYDAKDMLLQQLDTAPDAPDYLSRTYWTRRILGTIERIAAVQEWEKVLVDDEYPLERALGAIDLCFAENPPETLDELSEHLNHIAMAFRLAQENFEDMTTRERVKALTTFLSKNNLIGVHEQDYRKLENNLISLALCSQNHPSLPLISGAIFCCVARRIGVSASLCNFPFHIVCVVSATEGHDLDNRQIPESSSQFNKVMYMDPFRTAEEITRSSLETQLDLYGTPPSQRDSYLEPMSTRSALLRTSRNLLLSLEEAQDSDQSVQTVLNSPTQSFLPQSVKPLSPVTLNLEDALYCTGIINLLFNTGEFDYGIIQVLRRLANDMRHYTTDSVLFQLHLSRAVEVVNPTASPIVEHLQEYLAQAKREEGKPWPPKRRAQGSAQARSGNDVPRYRVGDLFVHRRYGYQAAIVGWDVKCKASEDWMRMMHVDRLPKGRGQSFYNVIAEDESERYVADENISRLVSKDPRERRDGTNVVTPSEKLLRVAGKYFKRWDAERERFVSNLEDLYPDD